jgi:hypothetical protein
MGRISWPPSLASSRTAGPTALLGRMPDRKGASPPPPPEVSAAQLRKATDEIAALIEERLPLQLPPDDIWPPVAHGFLARAGTLLESVTLSVERRMPGEAQMLLRILIEHDMPRPRSPE